MIRSQSSLVLLRSTVSTSNVESHNYTLTRCITLVNISSLSILIHIGKQTHKERIDPPALRVVRSRQAILPKIKRRRIKLTRRKFCSGMTGRLGRHQNIKNLTAMRHSIHSVPYHTTSKLKYTSTTVVICA